MKLTYTNKVALNENAEIPDINKVTDNDMNEIKNVVNNNDDELITINTKLTNATTYSTDEIRVGTWMDNKSIYRKVITLRNGEIRSGYYEYNHNISNLDKVLNIYGMCYSSTQQHPIQRVVPDEMARWGIGLGDIKQSTFALHFGSGYQDINLVYIVIEYTKTTD